MECQPLETERVGLGLADLLHRQGLDNEAGTNRDSFRAHLNKVGPEDKLELGEIFNKLIEKWSTESEGRVPSGSTTTPPHVASQRPNQ